MINKNSWSVAPINLFQYSIVCCNNRGAVANLPVIKEESLAKRKFRVGRWNLKRLKNE